MKIAMITAHPSGSRRPPRRATDALATNRLHLYGLLVACCTLKLQVPCTAHGLFPHVAVRVGLIMSCHVAEDSGLGIKVQVAVSVTGVARVVIVATFIMVCEVISGFTSTSSSSLCFAAFLWLRERVALRAFIHSVLDAKASSALVNALGILRASDASPRGALAPTKAAAQLVVLTIVGEQASLRIYAMNSGSSSSCYLLLLIRLLFIVIIAIPGRAPLPSPWRRPSGSWR